MPVRKLAPPYSPFALEGLEGGPEPWPLALEDRDVERRAGVKLEEVALLGGIGELESSGTGCNSQGVTSSTGPVPVCPKELECVDLGKEGVLGGWEVTLAY
jgi:hypothetical protein